MVKCFFSTEYAKEKENLFKGTNVWEDDEMMEIQGTYPVISMSFGKDKSSSVDSIINTIKFEICNKFVHELEVPTCYWLSTSDNSLV